MGDYSGKALRGAPFLFGCYGTGRITKVVRAIGGNVECVYSDTRDNTVS